MTVQKNRTGQPSVIDLHNGDSMTQTEFHRTYEQMPEGFKAELIDGVVFVCEPLGLEHGCNHADLCVKPKELRWFDLRSDCQLKADSDGVFRSIAFPGFWINPEELLGDRYHSVMETLNRGLASVEHADFVARLAAARG